MENECNRHSDILTRMAAFDFNAPVNATIIFEDSDEEESEVDHNIKDSTDDEKVKNDQRVNTITSNKNWTVCSDTKESNKNNIHIFSPSKWTLSSETEYSNDKNIDDNKFKKLLIENNNISNNLGTVCLGNKESNKVKLSNNNSNDTLLQLSTETNCNKDFYGNNSPHDHNKCKKRKLNSPVSAKVKEKEQLEQSDGQKKPNDTLEYLHSAVNISTSSNDKMENCIGDLLKSVSNHLIIIMQYYIFHMKQKYSKSPDPAKVQKSFDNFMRIKNHLFNLSYCSVVTIMLPKYENVHFFSKFLLDTVKMANQNQISNINYEQISSVLAELLDWTIHKKRTLNNIPTQFNEATNIQQPQPYHSLLKQRLTTTNLPVSSYINTEHSKENNSSVNTILSQSCPFPPSLTRNNPLPHDANQGQPLTTSFTFGHPGREINIQVDQGLLNNQNQAISSNICVTRSDRNYKRDIEMINRPNHGLMWADNEKKDINLPQNTSTLCPYLPHKNIASQDYQSQAVLPRPIPKNYQNEFFLPHNITKAYYNVTPEQRVGPPPPHHRALAQTHKPPTSSQNMPIGQLQDYVDRQQIQQFQNEATDLQSQSNALRSLSTDSGFTSPLHFHDPANSTNNMWVPEEQNRSPIPLITHVTSLNPNVSYINDGYCHVCGKITRLMCITCLKCYYCSNECQRADWDLHVFVCKKS